MARVKVNPVHVRLPPDDLEALRALATRRNSNVHAEVVRGVEGLLSSEGGPPELAAIKTATLAMLEVAHGGLADVLGRDFVLGQFRVAMTTLFDALKVEEPQERTITEAAAGKAIAQMQAGGQTPLGEAGYWLGLTKELSK